MHLSCVLTILPLLFLGAPVVARPTNGALTWSEDLLEEVNQLRARGMTEAEILERYPRQLAVPSPSRPISPFQPFLSLRPSNAYIPTTFPDVDLYDLEDIAEMTNGRGAGLFQRLEQCLRALFGKLSVSYEEVEGEGEMEDVTGDKKVDGEGQAEENGRFINGRRLLHIIDLQGTVGLRGGQMGKGE